MHKLPPVDELCMGTTSDGRMLSTSRNKSAIMTPPRRQNRGRVVIYDVLLLLFFFIHLHKVPVVLQHSKARDVFLQVPKCSWISHSATK